MRVELQVQLAWSRSPDGASPVIWPDGCRVPTVGERVYDSDDVRAGSVSAVDWNLVTDDELITWVAVVSVTED